MSMEIYMKLIIFLKAKFSKIDRVRNRNMSNPYLLKNI